MIYFEIIISRVHLCKQTAYVKRNKTNLAKQVICFIRYESEIYTLKDDLYIMFLDHLLLENLIWL